MFVLSTGQRRRLLVADLISTAVFPLAITGSTAVAPIVATELPGPAALGPWIVLVYNGIFAATLLLAGASADRTKRTRFFAAGNVVVAAAGILSIFVPNLLMLVVLRAAAGVGAAMCAAGGSSVILAVYAPEDRRRVFGYSGAVLGCGLAMGPIVTQLLLAVGGWQLVFVGPAAIAGTASVLTWRLPSLRSEGIGRSFDLAGATLFGLTVAAAVIGLGVGFGSTARSWASVALLVLALAAGAALAGRERRIDHPAIPLDVLKVAAYRAYAIATGALMGMLVVGLTALPRLAAAQRIGPTGSAIILSLLTIPSTVLPLLAARLARRWARPLVAVGLIACAAAAGVVVATDRQVGLFVAAAVTGVALGLTEGVPDGQALRYVPSHRGGAGAALFSTTRMSLETFTLAAATGVMATLGPASGMVVAGGGCLAAAVIVWRGVPRHT